MAEKIPPPENTNRKGGNGSGSSPTAIELAFETAKRERAEKARKELFENGTKNEPTVEKSFDPHSVQSSVSVEEQKQNQAMREILAEEGLISPDLVSERDVDISGVNVLQYKAGADAQKDMDELNAVPEVPSAVETSESKVVPPELAQIYGDKVPQKIQEMYEKLKSPAKKESYVAKLRADKAEEEKKRTSKRAAKSIKKTSIDFKLRTGPTPLDFDLSEPTPEITPEARVIENIEQQEIDKRIETAHAAGEPYVEPERPTVPLKERTDKDLLAYADLTDIPSGAEGTPKEWREKLRELITSAREHLGGNERSERLKTYLAERSKNLQEKAKEYGPNIEKFIRSKGEEYNKLSFKKKLLIGGVLGIGAATFSTVSTPLAAAFAINLGIQRFGGMASVFVNVEKHLQETAEGTSKNFLGRREWYQNLFSGSSERQHKVLAALASVGYTAVAGTAIKGAIEFASESSVGETVHNWLKQHYPFGQAETPAQNRVVGKITAAPEVPQPATAAVAGEAITSAPVPEMPSVGASAGHGYEYMAKRLWEQLQDKGLDPSQYAEGSDIRRLLEADAGSIDKVVHQIAADPAHGFFNADGTSVRIDLDSRMTIGADGQIHVNDVAQAAENASMTPTYHPEVSADVSADAPAMPDYHSEALAAAVESPASTPTIHETIAIPEPIKTVDITQEQDLANQVVQPPIETPVSDKSVMQPTMTENPVTQAESVATPDALQTADTATQASVQNQFGLTVPTAEPHIYADPGAEHLFVYGGSPEERANAILEYLTQNPQSVVFSSDDSGTYRVPWHLVEGKAIPGSPMRTNGFFGFFSTWMKPPGPEEFEKVIK